MYVTFDNCDFLCSLLIWTFLDQKKFAQGNPEVTKLRV